MRFCVLLHLISVVWWRETTNRELLIKIHEIHKYLIVKIQSWILLDFRSQSGQNHSLIFRSNYVGYFFAATYTFHRFRQNCKLQKNLNNHEGILADLLWYRPKEHTLHWLLQRIIDQRTKIWNFTYFCMVKVQIRVHRSVSMQIMSL